MTVRASGPTLVSAQVGCWERLLPPRVAAPTQQHGLEQGLAERVTIVRERHGHTEFLTDFLGLAEDDLQHRAIHRVVGAVNQRGPDDGAPLAEAVHAAFALLVAGGIPGQKMAG